MTLQKRTEPHITLPKTHWTTLYTDQKRTEPTYFTVKKRSKLTHYTVQKRAEPHITLPKTH